DRRKGEGGRDRHHQDEDDQIESGRNLVRAKEERRPDKIRGKLDEEKQQRKAAPLRAARMQHHRKREAKANVEERPNNSENPPRRRDRRQVERREPAIVIAAVRHQTREASEQHDRRNRHQRPAPKGEAKLPRSGQFGHAHSPFAQIRQGDGCRDSRAPRQDAAFTAAIRNSTLPSGPVIGLSTRSATGQPSLSSQARTSSHTRAWTAASRTTPFF